MPRKKQPPTDQAPPPDLSREPEGVRTSPGADVNRVVLEGRLATAPEIREFESGSRLARLLVTTRTHTIRPRTDVVPVTLWDPPSEITELDRGDGVAIDGMVQRRFWTDPNGRQSRLEVVASSVTGAES